MRRNPCSWPRSAGLTVGHEVVIDAKRAPCLVLRLPVVYYTNLAIIDLATPVLLLVVIVLLSNAVSHPPPPSKMRYPRTVSPSCTNIDLFWFTAEAFVSFSTSFRRCQPSLISAIFLILMILKCNTSSTLHTK
jgi:hypothetical protein